MCKCMDATIFGLGFIIDWGHGMQGYQSVKMVNEVAIKYPKIWPVLAVK